MNNLKPLLKKFTITTISLFILLFYFSKPVNAAPVLDTIPADVDENTVSIQLVATGLNPQETYKFTYKYHDANDFYTIDKDGFKNITGVTSYTSPPVCPADNQELKETNCGDNHWFEAGEYRFGIEYQSGGGDIVTKTFSVRRTGPNAPTISPQSLHPGEPLTITLTGFKHPASVQNRNDYNFDVVDTDTNDKVVDNKFLDLHNTGTDTYEITNGLGQGNYQLIIRDHGDDDVVYWTVDFTVEPGGGVVEEPVNHLTDENGLPPGPPGRNPCDNPDKTCPTALGNISTDIGAFSTQFLSIAIGLAGGIALVLMVIGSVRVLMSSGDPKGVGAGRDMIIAAVAGLLFLIFSVLILKFIGLNILGGIV